MFKTLGALMLQAAAWLFVATAIFVFGYSVMIPDRPRSPYHQFVSDFTILGLIEDIRDGRFFVSAALWMATMACAGAAWFLFSAARRVKA